MNESFRLNIGDYIHLNNSGITSGSISFYTSEGVILNLAYSFNSINRIIKIESGNSLLEKDITKIGISINSGSSTNFVLRPAIYRTNENVSWGKYHPSAQYLPENTILKVGYNHIDISSGLISFDYNDVADIQGELSDFKQDFADLENDVWSEIKKGHYKEVTVSGSVIDIIDNRFTISPENVSVSSPSTIVYVSGNMFPTIAESESLGSKMSASSDGKGKIRVWGEVTSTSIKTFDLPESITLEVGMTVHLRNSMVVNGSVTFYDSNGVISGGFIAFNAINKKYTIPSTSVLVNKTVTKIGVSIQSGSFDFVFEPMVLWNSEVDDFCKYSPQVSYVGGSGIKLNIGYNHIVTDPSSDTISFSFLDYANSMDESEVRSIQNELYTATVLFETGKYDETDHGSPSSSWARIRSKNVIPLDRVTKIILPKDYSMQVHYYSESGQWSGYNRKWIEIFDVNRVSDEVKGINLVIRKTSTPNSDIRSYISYLQNNVIVSAVLNTRRLLWDVYKQAFEFTLQARKTKNISRDDYVSRNKPLTLLHFSDIHQEKDNLFDIVRLSKEYTSIIDDVICTGDIVGTRFSGGMTWFSEISGTEKILLAIGNHDTMTASTGYDDAQQATQAQTYAQYIEPYYQNWGSISDVSTNGLTYYYKDYPECNIRLIILNCMLGWIPAYQSDDDAQYEWFLSTLNDANTNELNVVIANHCMPSTSTFLDSNWTNSDYQTNQSYLKRKYQDAVDTFIGNGGHFACWFVGHAHADYLCKHVGENGTQVVIAVDAAGMESAQSYSDVNRRPDDMSFNSVNLVTIDTEMECIKVAKIGSCCNNKMIPRNALCVNFGGTIISQS